MNNNLRNASKSSSKLQSFNLDRNVIGGSCFDNYSLAAYTEDIEKKGLKETWNDLCEYILTSKNIADFLSIKNLGELYEIGLAIQNKTSKKKSGQYYTPDDVALVMSQWLFSAKGENVCDVGCGTGNLILTYLNLIGFENARKLISNGNLYLYDLDEIALKICKTSISFIYGLDIADKIHDIHCDFLDKNIHLPLNSKTISNPPYAKIEEISDSWIKTQTLEDTKEFYSCFMEKIFIESDSAVIITPFSFISSKKFYHLRKLMCDLGSGFIVAFDNVPGNIFCGRKHGIFNTNTANSVRAAISVFNKNDKEKGYRVTPLIRFKNIERNNVLNHTRLEMMLNPEIQTINNQNSAFRKIEPHMTSLYNSWVEKSNFLLKDLIKNDENNLAIDMPNTCRYFTTASSKKLSRGGSITIYAKNLETYYFIYCFINSSFAYWWWRIYDGGITYPLSLLKAMPMPFNLLTVEDKEFFKNTALEMIDNESKYVIKKVNAGVIQENIKFPDRYRKIINNKMLEILGFEPDEDIFNFVHANHFIF